MKSYIDLNNYCFNKDLNNYEKNFIENSDFTDILYIKLGEYGYDDEYLNYVTMFYSICFTNYLKYEHKENVNIIKVCNNIFSYIHVHHMFKNINNMCTTLPNYGITWDYEISNFEISTKYKLSTNE